MYHELNFNGQLFYYSIDTREGFSISFYKKVKAPKWKFWKFQSKEITEQFQQMFSVEFNINISPFKTDNLKIAVDLFYNSVLNFIDQEKIKNP